MRLLTLLLLLVAGCATKSDREIEDLPAWHTADGKRDLRMSILESLVDAGATSEALTLLTTMREEGDDRAELALFQGRALAREGFRAEAERVLRDYWEETPRDPRAPRALAVLYAETERPEEAIATLRRALEFDARHAATWNNLGFVLLSEGRAPEAREALQRAVELDGTQARYRNNLGFALAASGQVREAFEAFQSLGPPGEAHYNLAVALELAGEELAAARHYRRAVEHDPRHALSLDALERLERPLPRPTPASDPPSEEERP